MSFDTFCETRSTHQKLYLIVFTKLIFVVKYKFIHNLKVFFSIFFFIQGL